MLGGVSLQRPLGEVLVRVGEVQAQHLGERSLALQHGLDLGPCECGAEVHHQASDRRVTMAREALRLKVMNVPSPLLQ